MASGRGAPDAPTQPRTDPLAASDDENPSRPTLPPPSGDAAAAATDAATSCDAVMLAPGRPSQEPSPDGLRSARPAPPALPAAGLCLPAGPGRLPGDAAPRTSDCRGDRSCRGVRRPPRRPDAAAPAGPATARSAREGAKPAISGDGDLFLGGGSVPDAESPVLTSCVAVGRAPRAARLRIGRPSGDTTRRPALARRLTSSCCACHRIGPCPCAEGRPPSRGARSNVVGEWDRPWLVTPPRTS